MKYTIEAGDTAWSIAQKFDLRIESILWGNEGMSADAGSLIIGQEINILPEDGVLYTVQEEDTWETIEFRNGVEREIITEYPGNKFSFRSSTDLVIGEPIIIPGGKKPIVWLDPGPPVEAGKGRQSAGFYSGALVGIGTGVYILPVSPVRITQPYWDGHPALDFDTVTSQPIYAADGGTVIYSGWSESGYGNLVIIDHGTGYWTYYAHNDVNLVESGQGVYQGQQIAKSGNTGRSSGDHLDFRIRVEGGAFIDPTPLLPLQ
jgi:murein DD-endopeptidase MepM/ murein hydrolase activator NlpD